MPNINLFVSDTTATGATIPVDQYEVELMARWTGADGQPHERTEIVRFPNILGQVPGAWVREELTNLLIRAAREVWGVD